MSFTPIFDENQSLIFFFIIIRPDVDPEDTKPVKRAQNQKNAENELRGRYRNRFRWSEG